MKSSAAEILPILGTSMGGGFYAGRINVAGQPFALIVAPKADGELADTPWNKSAKAIDGALSFFDGRANTLAMAEGGSALAKWAQDLRIGGHADWYLPSQDELEVIYRALKPSTDANWLYGRSGINVSALPPTYPYTADLPAQTLAEAFQAGGEQAFELDYYWSSTQHASVAGFAWGQYFGVGTQSDDLKGYSFRARAVRRLII